MAGGVLETSALSLGVAGYDERGELSVPPCAVEGLEDVLGGREERRRVCPPWFQEENLHHLQYLEGSLGSKRHVSSWKRELLVNGPFYDQWNLRRMAVTS